MSFKYGNRESYNLAAENISNGIWKVDADQGLILSEWRGWLPIGSVRDGYVRVRLSAKGRHVSVHRVIWEYVNGPSDLDLTINHKDGNGLNNRIDNLEIQTNQENCDHAHKVLGRANQSRNKGSVNPRAKLDEDKVRKIKTLLNSGFHYKVVAKEFNVAETTIYSIKRGDNWSHIQ